jgi:uncharacterized protein (TIGR02217 family)
MSIVGFAEVLLDLGHDYSNVAKVMFQNTRQTVGGGAETVNIDWAVPLSRWTFGERTGLYALLEDEKDYLLDFFHARRGSAQPFRYLDWTDHRAYGQQIGVGDGSLTQFQLTKTYGDDYGRVVKPILKPLLDGFKVELTGDPIACGVDVTTGLVTFASAPPLGVKISCDFRFHKPVRFGSDELSLKFTSRDPDSGQSLFDLSAFELMEIRI